MTRLITRDEIRKIPELHKLIGRKRMRYTKLLNPSPYGERKGE